MLLNEIKNAKIYQNDIKIHPFHGFGCKKGNKTSHSTSKVRKMSTYKDQIEQMMYESSKLLENYIREYEGCVEGSLACCKTHGKDTFYHTFQNNGKYIRSVVGQETEMLKSLARKEYLNRSIKILRNNIDVLSKAGEKLQPMDIDYLRNKMLKPYRSLPDEYFFKGLFDRPGINQTDQYLEGIMRHVEWAKETYEKSTYKPENRKFPTSAGFNVRSKSEQSIVEQLVNYGVPFRYEEVIRINNWPYSSDFTFRDRERKKFYWEHAGMMDQAVYQNRHKRKMEAFEGVGIVPWKNLIVTYDIDGVINIPMIKSIIENDVLPRL